MRNRVLFLTIFILVITLFIILLTYPSQKPETQITASPSPVIKPLISTQSALLEQTKTQNCIANDKLPDSECTPGAVISGVTKEQICTPGYSKSVRNVPTSEKDQVYSEYGITSHQTGEYEVDHLISLELGGSNDIANLWPEPAEPRPGFHEKDKVENLLHDQVCRGIISLQDADFKIANDWMSVYKNNF